MASGSSSPRAPQLFEVACVVHVHSTYSDGTATVPEIAAAAKRSAADAVLLTDHDTRGAARDGWEGMTDGVFIAVGDELTTAGGGHYVAFGLTRDLDTRSTPARSVATDVRRAGGVGFAAHPFSGGGNMLWPRLARRVIRPHPWRPIDDPASCDAIELWSVTTDAAESWRTPAAAATWLRDPLAAVAAGPPRHHLHAWDRHSKRRRLPAVGGLDSHQPGIRVCGRVISPLSHDKVFALLQTRLLCRSALSGDVPHDRRVLLRAIMAGSAWIHCPAVALAAGARFWCNTSDGRRVEMGSETVVDRGVLHLQLPCAADVDLISDGVPAGSWSQVAELEVPVRAGVHRVEARIGGAFWLLSNPIHLRTAMRRRPDSRPV